MCLSELSVVLFLWNITPVQKGRQLLFGLGSFTVLWAVIGVIVSAAECRSPTPWDYFKGDCINRVRIRLFWLPPRGSKPANLERRLCGGMVSKS